MRHRFGPSPAPDISGLLEENLYETMRTAAPAGSSDAEVRKWATDLIELSRQKGRELRDALQADRQRRSRHWWYRWRARYLCHGNSLLCCQYIDDPTCNSVEEKHLYGRWWRRRYERGMDQ